LKKVTIEGGTEADKTKFNTALYRSYCARATLSDVDGKYLDMCEQVVQLEDPDLPSVATRPLIECLLANFAWQFPGGRRIKQVTTFAPSLSRPRASGQGHDHKRIQPETPLKD